jgi:hypothetical protein
MKFEDETLQRLMFAGADPEPLYAGGKSWQVGGTLEAGPAFSPKSSRLLILAPDGQTVLGAIPLQYPAPGD